MIEWDFESRFAAPLAGVDEAGRGPWAGPVVAAAVLFTTPSRLEGVDDSKRLRPHQRAALYTMIHQNAIVGVGIASVEEIDELNILHATMLAMQRAVAALPIAPASVLIDGNRTPSLPMPATAIVGGDARSPSIAAASIIAKVTRDRMMEQLGAAYPAYGFERHAGYGTPQHQTALRVHGVTPHHRRSFAPIRALLSAADPSCVGDAAA